VGLPGSRAIVGGFLIAAAAVGIFSAYTSATSQPTSAYVVVRRDVPVGERLARADLALATLELPAAQRARAFDDPSALVGATVVGPLREDDLVQASDVVRSGGGVDDRELSFAVDASRALGGRIKPGERVDILSTYGSGDTAFTTTVVAGALVVDVGKTNSRLGADSGTLVLTVAVTSDEQAMALAHATDAGHVTVVRSNHRSTAPSDRPSSFRPQSSSPSR
jgi:Flp pilus assembly protein CpaB